MNESRWFETSWSVQYYETDRMGIVHHSNYVRWFETARVAFMEAIGVPLPMLEREQIVIPVVDVYAKYRYPARFGDQVKIKLSITSYSGVRACFGYCIENQDCQVVCEGKSTHAFTSSDSLRVLSLARAWPALHERLNEIVSGRALWEENPACVDRPL